jgi:hypothetical protein
MIDIEGPEKSAYSTKDPDILYSEGEIQCTKKILQAEEHATAQVQEGGPIKSVGYLPVHNGLAKLVFSDVPSTVGLYVLHHAYYKGAPEGTIGRAPIL